MPQSDEVLFESFRSRRDVEALTVLFHRRAEELLRLAMFLAPRPSDAEDLVQATFLSAISRATTYRPEHRVMSWLCGILTNHARMLRRAERRAAPTGENTPHDTPHVDDDPVDQALRAELRQALSSGIAALAEPYRSVLALHLRHGFNSAEISARLDRPAATVRKQMERGLDQLRGALPLGLATGLLAQLSPAQIAARAAEAATFVDAGGDELLEDTLADEAAADVLAADGGDTALEPMAGSGRWSPRALLSPPLAIATLAATLCLYWSLAWSWSAPPPPTTLATVANAGSAADASASRAMPDPAASLQLPRAAEPAPRRLRVRVQDPDGRPHANVALEVAADDGRAWPLRLAADGRDPVFADATGVAEFELPPGRYQLGPAGGLPLRTVVVPELHDAPDLTITDLVLCLPAQQAFRGWVRDAAGAPVANAEIWGSETAGRGDLGHLVTHSAADGSFAGSLPLASARVFARHPAHGQSAGARLGDGELLLQLEAQPAPLPVLVLRPDGMPAPCAVVTLVPQSQGFELQAPLRAVADGHGRCVLPHAAHRAATLLAELPGHAAAKLVLDAGPAPSAGCTLRLAVPTRVHGLVLDAAGHPLADQLVTISVCTDRANEPIAPLLARQARSDADGHFAIDGLPAARLLARIYGGGGEAGPTMQQFVRAGLEVDTRNVASAAIELVVRSDQQLAGRLLDALGRPLAGWHVLAVPGTGSATHRMFRRRVAASDADGRFVLPDVAADETYQLGAYAPDQWWPQPLGWPVAFADAHSGTAFEWRIDATGRPGATLHFQALLPDGRGAAGATFELRATALHAPLTGAADHRGMVHFGPLPAGDYWLVVASPGLGSRTIAVGVPERGGDVEAGTIQLELPCQLTIDLGIAGVTVSASHQPGDKYVQARSCANGLATLPPLPPGECVLRVQGPGLLPLAVRRQLPPGVHHLQLTPSRAPQVTFGFPFAAADNPFVVNGPLHVRVFDDAGTTVLDDYVGTAQAVGRFELVTGLAPGRYRIVARSLWNAAARGELEVPTDGRTVQCELPLRP